MDIDIDLPKDFNPTTIFKDRIVLASLVENDELQQHGPGVYFQKIPVDKFTGLAAIPYKNTEELGYIKIDFLRISKINLNIFNNKKELKQLLNIPPDWTMLENENFVNKLWHLEGNFNIVSKIKPKSIDDLADILALIRPRKLKLLDKYLLNKESVRVELYTKREKSDLRKSHAIPYAMLIVIHMHLLTMEIDK